MRRLPAHSGRQQPGWTARRCTRNPTRWWSGSLAKLERTVDSLLGNNGLRTPQTTDYADEQFRVTDITVTDMFLAATRWEFKTATFWEGGEIGDGARGWLEGAHHRPRGVSGHRRPSGRAGTFFPTELNMGSRVVGR